MKSRIDFPFCSSENATFSTSLQLEAIKGNDFSSYFAGKFGLYAYKRFGVCFVCIKKMLGTSTQLRLKIWSLLIFLKHFQLLLYYRLFTSISCCVRIAWHNFVTLEGVFLGIHRETQFVVGHGPFWVLDTALYSVTAIRRPTKAKFLKRLTKHKKLKDAMNFKILASHMTSQFTVCHEIEVDIFIMAARK